MILAGIVSCQAARSANENIPAGSIVAEMKRIMLTVIEALDLQVKNAGDEHEAILTEEKIRRASLDDLQETYTFVKIR